MGTRGRKQVTTSSGQWEWLGVVTRTHGPYMGAPEGVVRARPIKRAGEHERLKRDGEFAIKGSAGGPGQARRRRGSGQDWMLM